MSEFRSHTRGQGSLIQVYLKPFVARSHERIDFLITVQVPCFYRTYVLYNPAIQFPNYYPHSYQSQMGKYKMCITLAPFHTVFGDR